MTNRPYRLMILRSGIEAIAQPPYVDIWLSDVEIEVMRIALSTTSAILKDDTTRVRLIEGLEALAKELKLGAAKSNA